MGSIGLMEFQHLIIANLPLGVSRWRALAIIACPYSEGWLEEVEGGSWTESHLGRIKWSANLPLANVSGSRQTYLECWRSTAEIDCSSSVTLNGFTQAYEKPSVHSQDCLKRFLWDFCHEIYSARG
jgi:hypothetical protein